LLPAIGLTAATIAALYLVPTSGSATQSVIQDAIVLVAEKKKEEKKMGGGVQGAILANTDEPTPAKKKKAPSTETLCTQPGGNTPKGC
jgi:hypothetical protein